MLEFKNIAQYLWPSEQKLESENTLTLMYCLLSPRKLETRCWYTVIEHSHMCITLIARVKELKRVGKMALASLLPSKSHISSHIWWKLFQTHNSS